MVFSILLLIFCSKSTNIISIASSSIFSSLTLCVQLGVVYIFWCGVLEIVQALELHKKLANLAKRVLNKLFPNANAEAKQAIATNLSCNMLGLSNASLPCGIEALNKLAPNKQNSNLLIILNCISLQLIPTTIMTLYITNGGTSFFKIWLLSLVICFLILIFAVFLNLAIKSKKE